LPALLRVVSLYRVATGVGKTISLPDTSGKRRVVIEAPSNEHSKEMACFLTSVESIMRQSAG
jgi:hypothetical protein